MRALTRTSPEAYWYTLRGLAEGHAWDVVPSMRVPTLIIAAANDTLVPLSEMERMRDAMPHAHWLRVDDAGHAGLLEAGTEIADAVRAFLVQHVMEAPPIRAWLPRPWNRGRAEEGAGAEARLVSETTSPVFTNPTDVEVEAAGSSGAVVDFVLTSAVDAVTASPQVTANHDPGAPSRWARRR